MNRRRYVLLAMIGILVSSGLVSRLLAANDWNPTTTIKFAEVFPEQNAYAEDLLGPIVVAPLAGHDGKFFFSQAMDPFYLEPDVHAVYLDRPSYRAQRMLYPTLAGFGGLFGPVATAWGLIVVNVLAMGVGTVLTARVADEVGLSHWFGLAFPLNPGMIVSLNIDGAEILALAGLMGAVLAAFRDRPGWAAAALCTAALTRETMLLAAFGLIAFWLWQRRRLPVVLLTPFAAVAGWWAYVHWRLDDGLAQDTQALDLPMRGFLGALQNWMGTPGSEVHFLMGLILLFVSIATAVRALLNPTPLSSAVAGFALLAVILSEPVWERYFDSSRALAPVLTAYIIMVPAQRQAERAARFVPASHEALDRT